MLGACFQGGVPISMCIMCLAELQQQLPHGITACCPGAALLLQSSMSACQQQLSSFLPLLHDAAALLV